MAEAADSSPSLRTERKALQKAKILQRESERNVFKLVRHETFHFCRLCSSRVSQQHEAPPAEWSSSCSVNESQFCASCAPRAKVRRALKKPESERSEEEVAVLLLHSETVEELCRRQVRTDVLKRKQEEVRMTPVCHPRAFECILLAQARSELVQEVENQRPHRPSPA